MLIFYNIQRSQNKYLFLMRVENGQGMILQCHRLFFEGRKHYVCVLGLRTMFSLFSYWKGIRVRNLQSVQYIWGILYWFLWKALFGTRCRYAHSLGNRSSLVVSHTPKLVRIVHISDTRTWFSQCKWCVPWIAESIHFLQKWGLVFEAAEPALMYFWFCKCISVD